MSAATSEEISGWFDEGTKLKATHMLVVCDTFDHDDYPVFVKKGEDVKDVVMKYSGNMQRVIEVYNLSKDKKKQMTKTRCWEY